MKPGQHASLVPVIGAAGCAGHLRRSAKGFRATAHEQKSGVTFSRIVTPRAEAFCWMAKGFEPWCVGMLSRSA
jgi:hypothetical protein